MKRVAVLASGRGSNLGALIAAQSTFPSYGIVLVISNIASSGALQIARDAGIDHLAIPSKGIPREEHEQLVLSALRAHDIDCVCLAGYMRVLGAAFLDGLAKPVLNIHPSLLPAFPGMHAQKQALDAGVRWSGVTVHLVDAGLDSGPVILQEPVRVDDADTEETLSARILVSEHEIYPKALDIVARCAFEQRGRRLHQ